MIDIEKLAEEHAAQVALLRKLYRFSETEAEDFLERFGAETEPTSEGLAA